MNFERAVLNLSDVRNSFYLILCFVCLSFSLQAQKFDKKSYYNAIASKDIAAIDKELTVLKSLSFKEKEGFEGALLMKKAGLVTPVKEKLALFKTGHKLLEETIKNDESNAELRFLRLMIQENAPAILKYNKDIEKDSNFIRKFFLDLEPEVQEAVVDYSKISKVLKTSDLKR